MRLMPPLWRGIPASPTAAWAAALFREASRVGGLSLKGDVQLCGGQGAVGAGGNVPIVDGVIRRDMGAGKIVHVLQMSRRRDALGAPGSLLAGLEDELHRAV